MNASVVLAVVLSMGVALIAIGGSLLRGGGPNRDRRAVAGWVPAAGVVVGLERASVAPTTADATVAVRYPIVRYVDASGRERQGRAVTAASWRRHDEGEPVGLRYDPDDPGRVVLDGEPVRGPLSTLVAVVFILFGIFWAAIGLAGLVITRF